MFYGVASLREAKKIAIRQTMEPAGVMTSHFGEQVAEGA
jgi:hypothetical protein